MDTPPEPRLPQRCSHIDTSASPMAITSQETIDRKAKQNSAHNESPPSSPLTSHSGGSTPKSPNTPNNLEKDVGSGDLPPPIPISEDDLAPTNRINDHPIIPPPREFLGSAEDLARRRASEGSVIKSPPIASSSPASAAIGSAFGYPYPEGCTP